MGYLESFSCVEGWVVGGVEEVADSALILLCLFG